MVVQPNVLPAVVGVCVLRFHTKQLEGANRVQVELLSPVVDAAASRLPPIGGTTKQHKDNTVFFLTLHMALTKRKVRFRLYIDFDVVRSSLENCAAHAPGSAIYGCTFVARQSRSVVSICCALFCCALRAPKRPHRCVSVPPLWEETRHQNRKGFSQAGNFRHDFETCGAFAKANA